MAKKKKETFNDLLKKLKNESVQSPKPVATIEERRYYLIICEGERTEPIYFEYLKQLLPKNFLETIEIIGEGDNTIRIVEKAIAERDKRASDTLKPDFDEVWAVFDKDDFPDQRFNEAVSLAENNGIKNGASNQAFELWYILHFQLLQTAIGRNQYCDMLTKILGYKYSKNDKRVVRSLFERGNVKQAIKWAEMLEKIHEGRPPSQACPSTNVHRLVKSLLSYMQYDI